MKSGYKVLWTDHAISELKEAIEYLEKNWTERELRNFSAKLDHTIELISKTPEIFPSSFEKKEIRKAVVEKHNNLLL
ncbi:type II toxin-antitoxin system RelE/ParE family toxin [Yeosuana sp.]|uniref:type II toxin-antitoxin system RelE/ParE family toxin n=1 Tax=Yeosuana sp. TaxID=2529388 RepID=UPI004054F781|tara:strand:+ start:2895 stop:3125 length:231 start_codon:yes stop_codon:yes gene_type:complete